MLTITLFSVGPTRSSQCAALEAEYSKRIRGRFAFEQRYLKSLDAVYKELQSFSGSIVLLDEHGPAMTSREFATFLDQRSQAEGQTAFVIGDAEGFSDDFRQLDASLLALSEMTLPHEMARVIITEQIYRAQTIIEGHPYHK